MNLSLTLNTRFYYPFMMTVYGSAILYALLKFSWKELAITYFMFFLYHSFGVSFTMHRWAAHRCFDIGPITKFFGTIIGSLCGFGSQFDWAVGHYLHHKAPDKERDPHAPHIYGFPVALGMYNFKPFEKTLYYVQPNSDHLVTDKLIMGIRRWYYAYLYGAWLILFLLLSFKTFLIYFLIPTGLSYIGTNFLNYFCHGRGGYRNFKTPDESTNVPWMFFFTFGENWHNNHHHHGAIASHRVKWWEVDLVMIWVYLLGKNIKKVDRILD